MIETRHIVYKNIAKVIETCLIVSKHRPNEQMIVQTIVQTTSIQSDRLFKNIAKMIETRRIVFLKTSPKL